MTDPYDTTEAIQLLVKDRAKRYSQDFLEAREVAAIALRDAVMQSAAAAGYYAAEVDGHHGIAPRDGTSAVVVLLANADGVRVARRENGRLTDEVQAGLAYDAVLDAWVTEKRTAAKESKDSPAEAKESNDAVPEQQPEAKRSPVAVVAELVIAALQKIQ